VSYLHIYRLPFLLTSLCFLVLKLGVVFMCTFFSFCYVFYASSCEIAGFACFWSLREQGRWELTWLRQIEWLSLMRAGTRRMMFSLYSVFIASARPNQFMSTDFLPRWHVYNSLVIVCIWMQLLVPLFSFSVFFSDASMVVLMTSISYSLLQLSSKTCFRLGYFIRCRWW